MMIIPTTIHTSLYSHREFWCHATFKYEEHLLTEIGLEVKKLYPDLLVISTTDSPLRPLAAVYQSGPIRWQTKYFAYYPRIFHEQDKLWLCMAEASFDLSDPHVFQQIAADLHHEDGTIEDGMVVIPPSKVTQLP